MYKTIRHGENSLQYTILPQNDDFRTNPIDAEQMNAYRRNGNSNGTSRTGNNSNRTCIKRKNKSSLLAYIGLFFVCSVVTGAILVPLLVTTDLMPSPASWFFKAQKARELRNPANVKMSTIDKQDSNSNNNNNNNNLNSNNINDNSNSIYITTATSTIKNLNSDINKTATTNDLNVNSTSININSNSNNNNNNNNNSAIGIQTPLSSSLLFIPINGSSESMSSINASLDIYIIGNNNSKNNMTSEILTVTATPSIISYTTPATAPSISSTVIPPPSTRETAVKLLNILKPNAIDSPVITTTTTTTTPTRTAKSIVSEININPNKPRILYQEITSRKNSSANNQTTDYVAKVHLTPSETNKNADTKNWIRTHWPFIDPSTYFQWAGYDSEDSIILPAILCAALVVIFLIITLCVLARNRKLFFNSIWVRKRSRNDPFGRGVANDVQGADDNTTLLVNENASEEE